jgi:hypothetical protein
MANDGHPTHATLPRPVILDGVWFSNLRAAAKATELSYGRLYESIRRGRSSIDGRTVAEPPEQFTIEVLNDDEADLRLCRKASRRPRTRKKGDLLLCYPPGEKPLDRGSMTS